LLPPLLAPLRAGIKRVTVCCCSGLRVVPDELRALRGRDLWRINIFCCEALSTAERNYWDSYKAARQLPSTG
jgi:hypothetical protein